ncbi:MAG TPA: single-stranded-DNA-specific exonuclease RecJ [Chloroflexota bacterium]|nr:single-stranded-DNA-specific exonuclease RecJ [Chloroflexota bacterium]
MVVAEAPTARPWTVAPPAPSSLAAALPDLHPVAVQVLHARGYTTPEAILAFLFQDQLHDPLALYGMDRAVARLRRAIGGGEQIAAHGDFDVDGVTAAAVLVEGLSAAGARIVPFLPARTTTGYGVHASAVDKLAADGVTLIVTGDTGTRAIEAVQRAAELGIDVIVTDHHLPGETLPAALALVNPHLPLCPYPFKELSGVGVAWKLVDALSRSVPFNGLASDDLLDLVALGTIVDVSPLVGENRWLVRRGLDRLARSRRPGIQALLAQADREGPLDERTVAFSIGPRLNAAGRMESADLAYDLLTTKDHSHAFELVQRLDRINQERQQLTERVLAEARVQADRASAHPVLLIRGRDWPSGVLGLVAARLSDEYSRPAIVLDVGPEASRGSGRASGSDLDLVALLGACGDLLLEFGGHAQAAGFALGSERVDAFAERLLAACADRPDPSLAPVIADHRLDAAGLDWALYHGLCALRPYGQANPAPVFLSEAVPVVEARAVGAAGKHLRLRLRFGRQTLTAFGPNLGARLATLGANSEVDLLFCLESSVWNGAESLELRLRDVRGTLGT